MAFRHSLRIYIARMLCTQTVAFKPNSLQVSSLRSHNTIKQHITTN